MRQVRVKWIVAGVLALSAAGGAAAYGWQLRVERVEVVGARWAAPSEIVRLARVDTSMAMRAVDPALVEDRMRRHPWVAAARAVRMPGGTLRLRVAERVPVALALDARGDAAFYLDAHGHAMPATDAAVFHVPVVRGVRPPPHPTQPVASPAVRALVAELPALSPGQAALAAEFALEGGELVLWTPAAPSGRSLRVRLGERDFAARLAALDAFWHRELLPYPTRDVAAVDLRFDGQLVTTGGGA